MKFKTWKTIKLGTGLTTGDDFRAAIEASGSYIAGYRVQVMLDSQALGVSPVPIEVKLVNVSVEEMGFYVKREGWNDITSASLEDIYQRAQEFGLGLCTAEVGPQLRLQYLDQPKVDADHVYIGMHLIPVPASEKHIEGAIFLLGSLKGEFCLSEISLAFYQQFYLRHRFIFLQKNR